MCSERIARPVRRHAVIDIGSIAVRLHIGTLAENKIITEVFTRMPLGLGGGTYNGQRQRITAAATRRLSDTLLGMRYLVNSMKPCRISTVATAAVRDAANRQQVLESVRQHSGIRVRVLSGREEAAIIGCYATAHFSAPAVLNADIGGGSTDCAVIIDGKLAAAATFALGTARAGGGVAAEKKRCGDWLQQHTPPAAILSSSGGSALQLQQCCGKLTLRRLAGWQKKISGLSTEQLSLRYDMSPDRAAHAKDAVEIYRLILQSTAAAQIIPVRGGLSEALIWNKLAT